MFWQPRRMAVSSVSGAVSPTQLAVLEQIRALRAARPSAAAAAPVQPSPPVQAKAAVAAVDHTANLAAADPQANRPRGSILNIVA
jgi:hypothetical protein